MGLPFTVKRARRLVEWGVAREVPPPELVPLASPPPTGLTLVWFECGYLGLHPGEYCLAETAEVRRATEAFGWDLSSSSPRQQTTAQRPPSRFATR